MNLTLFYWKIIFKALMTLEHCNLFIPIVLFSLIKISVKKLWVRNEKKTIGCYSCEAILILSLVRSLFQQSLYYNRTFGWDSWFSLRLYCKSSSISHPTSDTRFSSLPVNCMWWVWFLKHRIQTNKDLKELNI